MAKKTVAVLLSVIMLISCFCGVTALASDGGTLSFNSDGKFKIMMMNDIQDTELTNSKTISFMEAALDSEKPDLVVFVGDQLSDMYPFANPERITKAIGNILAPVVNRGIPFLVTLGNHDHDREDVMSSEDQMAAYKAYAECYVPQVEFDSGTYNVPVLSSDGEKVALNIYVMDTNNKSEALSVSGYSGVNPEQVEWYKQTSDELKAANGGVVVPSLLFQHVPVKEIYQFVTQVTWGNAAKNAVFGTNDNKWYVLNESKIVSDEKSFGEAPCSELATTVTGQYEAWLEKGDIIGAYFGHDHVNNFVGITDEGIKMGYNGGTGFNAYGNGGNRSVRVFTIDENDPASYDTYAVTYNELMNENLSFYATDILSTKILTLLMRVVNLMFGEIIRAIQK